MAAAVMAGVIVRVQKKDGTAELVVEVDDPSIEVTVRQGTATLYNRTKDRTFVLKPGAGEVEFHDPATGVTLQTRRFKLERNGREVVSATVQEVAAVKPPSPAAANTTPTPVVGMCRSRFRHERRPARRPTR